MTKAISNFKRLQSMSVEELADWLDKNGNFDDSPWLIAFNEKYCEKCDSIKCKYADAEKVLGFSPLLYDGSIWSGTAEVECAYCEVYNKCRYFENLDDIPDNKEVIKMWLEEEAE